MPPLRSTDLAVACIKRNNGFVANNFQFAVKAYLATKYIIAGSNDCDAMN